MRRLASTLPPGDERWSKVADTARNFADGLAYVELDEEQVDLIDRIAHEEWSSFERLEADPHMKSDPVEEIWHCANESGSFTAEIPVQFPDEDSREAALRRLGHVLRGGRRPSVE